MNKAELLEEIRAGRVRLETALARLDDTQMVTPGLENQWSVKDMLAHLAFWEQRVTTILRALQGGRAPESTIDEASIDGINARVYNDNHGRPLADVREAEHQAYQDLLALVEAAPEADLVDPDRFAWTEGRSFLDWIAGNTYGHYDEHLPSLLKWIEAVEAS